MPDVIQVLPGRAEAGVIAGQPQIDPLFRPGATELLGALSGQPPGAEKVLVDAEVRRPGILTIRSRWDRLADARTLLRGGSWSHLRNDRCTPDEDRGSGSQAEEPRSSLLAHHASQGEDRSLRTQRRVVELLPASRMRGTNPSG